MNRVPQRCGDVKYADEVEGEDRAHWNSYNSKDHLRIWERDAGGIEVESIHSFLPSQKEKEVKYTSQLLFIKLFFHTLFSWLLLLVNLFHF